MSLNSLKRLPPGNRTKLPLIQPLLVKSLQRRQSRGQTGLVYCFSSCSCGQLSHWVSLCALFTKPMAGKAQAGRLDENSKSCRNFRHVSSLLAGAAATAADTLYSFLSWLIQWIQSQKHTDTQRCFLHHYCKSKNYKRLNCLSVQ